ncbi:MAG: fatty acid metabolism transcriptional regulator FadR [Chloroflexota bacterium]|nr:fatty acid metabolism transcriptional regulator FadR [Chloroflexota bacterium]
MTTYQNDTDPKSNWEPILKPAEIIETRLIKAILTNTFPINSNLPGERELSDSLGVTRPTLREALQRLERDGWIEIHQGKPTRVRDYWKEGRLGVLNSLAEHFDSLSNRFVPDLLEVRLAMAPMYSSLAVKNASDDVIEFLRSRDCLNDLAEKFSCFDWELQHRLSLLSGNPVFVMILNSFDDLYLKLAPLYFSIPEARQRSLAYYQDFAEAAEKNDPILVKTLTEEVMQDSIIFWQQTNSR